MHNPLGVLFVGDAGPDQVVDHAGLLLRRHEVRHHARHATRGVPTGEAFIGDRIKRRDRARFRHELRPHGQVAVGQIRELAQHCHGLRKIPAPGVEPHHGVELLRATVALGRRLDRRQEPRLRRGRIGLALLQRPLHSLHHARDADLDRVRDMVRNAPVEALQDRLQLGVALDQDLMPFGLLQRLRCRWQGIRAARIAVRVRHDVGKRPQALAGVDVVLPEELRRLGVDVPAQFHVLDCALHGRILVGARDTRQFLDGVQVVVAGPLDQVRRDLRPCLRQIGEGQFLRRIGEHAAEAFGATARRALDRTRASPHRCVEHKSAGGRARDFLHPDVPPMGQTRLLVLPLLKGRNRCLPSRVNGSVYHSIFGKRRGLPAEPEANHIRRGFRQ